MGALLHIILIIIVLCVSGSAHAVTASGTMGVEIITNVFSLSKEVAEKFCAENINNPNCDVFIADDKNKHVRATEFVERVSEKQETISFIFEEKLLRTEYPIRMLNFE